MNPIYHIQTDINPQPTPISIDLGTITLVSAPRFSDEPSFWIYQTGTGDAGTVRFRSTETMLSERQRLVTAWEEYKQRTAAVTVPGMGYVIIDVGTGVWQAPVCLDGISNVNPVCGETPESSCELYVSYFDKRSETYLFANESLMLEAVNKINTALVRG